MESGKVGKKDSAKADVKTQKVDKWERGKRERRKTIKSESREVGKSESGKVGKQSSGKTGLHYATPSYALLRHAELH